MQVLIKKFSLIHDGIEYKAGEVAELPDDVGERLIIAAPSEFAEVPKAVIKTTAKSNINNIKSKKKTEPEEDDALPPINPKDTVKK